MKDRLASSAFRAPAASRRPRGRHSSRVPGFAVDSEISRMVTANTSLLTFAGLTLGVFVSRRFFILPLAAAVVMAQDVLKARWLGRT